MASALRLLIIGGKATSDFDPDPWHEGASDLGAALATSNLKLAVCSAHASSVDRHVVDAFVAAGGHPSRISVDHPDDNEIALEWRELERIWGAPPGATRPRVGPDFRSSDGRIYAFLHCQLRALDSAAVVVVLGGQLNGSAHLLVEIARGRGIPVLPFSFAGGLGERLVEDFRYQLADVLGPQVALLRRPDGPGHIVDLVAGIVGSARREAPRVFISYPWRRPGEADHLETEFRRRDIDVFRDEREIRLGEDVEAKLHEALEDCDIFVGLWSSEYVRSPWCFDEFHSVMERRKRSGNPMVVLLRLDDTRLVWRVARSGTTNWPEVKDRDGLRLAAANILRDYQLRTS